MSAPDSTPAGTSRIAGPPRVCQVPPAFALPDTLGGVTRLYAFRQRQPVLLAFVSTPISPALRDWLSTLASHRTRLDELRVASLVVVPESISTLLALAPTLDLPFRLLLDADGAVATRYAVTGEPLALFALNRYGYLLHTWHATSADDLPPVDAALDHMASAEIGDCGCGLPAWPREPLESEDE